MRYIANILTEKKFSDYELYNVVSDKASLIDGIPTMVIGWEYTKKMFPEANIVDWIVEDGVYWTFGNREKRSVYEERMAKFKELAIDSFIKSINYRFISVITSKKEEIADFIGKVETEGGATAYYTNGFVYVYIPSSCVVYGLSLREMDYVGKNPKMFLSLLTKEENVSMVSAGESLSNEVRYSFRNRDYIIPYILS